MTKAPNLYQRCAQDISLLRLLGKVPVAPSRNDSAITPEGASSDYVLPPETERCLTSLLASLSSASDNFNRVAAVCVRETGGRLEVLIAANADHSHESGYLNGVEKGFRGILQILHSAQSASRETMHGLLLRAIVNTCRSRIISRTRDGLTQAKARLLYFVEQIAHDLMNMDQQAHVVAFREAIDSLGKKMRQYCEKRSRVNDLSPDLDVNLVGIICQCYRITRLHEWTQILLEDWEQIDSTLEHCSRSAVINMIEKLAQYESSAHCLVKMARQHPIICNSFTSLVRLGDDAFDRHGQRVLPVLPGEAFGRVASTGGSPIKYRELLGKLGLSKNQADSKFSTYLRCASKKTKVHAEMQLIWHMEIYPSSPPPRIIASHKDACYLCNAFIKYHKMYTTPGSHGTVHPGWRLPATGLKEVREGFAVRLEEIILERAAEVLRGAKEYDDPIGSRVFSPLPSEASISTLKDEMPADMGSSTSSTETVKPADKSSMSSSDSSSDTAVAEDAAGIAELGVSSIDFARATLPIVAPSEPTQPNDDHPWQTIKQEQTTRLRLTRKLHIHVSYSATQPARQLRVKTHELSTAEMTAMDAANGAEQVYDMHRDLPLLQDVLCRSNCRIVYLQMKSTSQGQTRRFRVELG